MPSTPRTSKRRSRSRTEPAPEPVEQPDEGKDKAEREFQRDADIVLALLADGLPHTRVEIGEHAAKHGISDARLGAIKSRMRIAHVRIQPGSENGLGRSVFAWIVEK